LARKTAGHRRADLKGGQKTETGKRIAGKFVFKENGVGGRPRTTNFERRKQKDGENGKGNDPGAAHGCGGKGGVKSKRVGEHKNGGEQKS